jgi:uncharacterized protein YuzE
MRTLQRVTRDTTSGHSFLYLFYSTEPVAQTIDVTETGSVAVDVDACGETIGIELLNPGTAELEVLTKLARERDLSLDGLFSYA